MYGIGTAGRTVVNLFETKARIGCSELQKFKLAQREITYESLDRSVAKHKLELKEMLRKTREEADEIRKALKFYGIA